MPAGNEPHPLRGRTVRDYGQNGVVDVHDANLGRAAANVVVVAKDTGNGTSYIWRHGTGARLTRGQCAHLLARLARDEMLCMSSLVCQYVPSNGN